MRLVRRRLQEQASRQPQHEPQMRGRVVVRTGPALLIPEPRDWNKSRTFFCTHRDKSCAWTGVSKHFPITVRVPIVSCQWWRTWNLFTACGSEQTTRASSRVTLSIMSFLAIKPLCRSLAKLLNLAKHCSRERHGPMSRDLLTTSEMSIQFSPNWDTAYTRAKS